MKETSKYSSMKRKIKCNIIWINEYNTPFVETLIYMKVEENFAKNTNCIFSSLFITLFLRGRRQSH